MPEVLSKNYKLEYTRYRHYYHRLWQYYQKPVARVSTALLLTIFTIIFFAAFAIRPTLVTVAELLKKINDQEQVLEKMQQKSAALATAQQEYMAAEERIQKLKIALPEDEALQQLITYIEATAAYHQLAYENVNYGEVNFLPPDEPQPGGEQSRDISLSLSGSYAAITSFLADVIRIPRFVTVTSATFAPVEEGSTTSDNLQLNLNLKAHYLAPGESSPAPQPTSTPEE